MTWTVKSLLAANCSDS